jgi:trimethylamine--corrinoid protein Co-methyltransferase
METDLRILSENEVAKVHERTLAILARNGVRVDTARGRAALKVAGADVDESSRVVRFPRELVEECLRLAPRKFSLGGRRPGWEFPLNVNGCSLVADGGATYILDSLSGSGARPPVTTGWMPRA